MSRSYPGAPHPRSEESYEDPGVTDGSRGIFPSLSSAATIDVSVIVPAYNEQERLPSMLEETTSYLHSRCTQEGDFSWEVIIVDDGSTDGTASVAMEFVRRYSSDRVRVLRMLGNVGKGGAVRRGVMVCRGRYVLMADADAATVFADVERLERVMSGGGVDVVVGSRRHLRGAHRRGVIRGFVSAVFGWVVVWVGGVRGVGDTQCGFKLYSREAARVAFVGQRLRRWAFDVENLYRVQKAGMRVAEVEVRWTEVAGSKLSVVKATVNMLWDMGRMRWGYWRGVWNVDVGGKAQ
eukprot:GFKZ01008270.1.p1 GENE.GFKZ01008270.1~~GFKZ01008270.1.p1  ORF type:complete len:293 (+),score=17.82 GFKZ01008270.1:250-1128(+)